MTRCCAENAQRAALAEAERDTWREQAAGWRALHAAVADDKEALEALVARACLFVRRVSLRHDNPPKWAEEASRLADALESVGVKRDKP